MVVGLTTLHSLYWSIEFFFYHSLMVTLFYSLHSLGLGVVHSTQSPRLSRDCRTALIHHHHSYNYSTIDHHHNYKIIVIHITFINKIDHLLFIVIPMCHWGLYCMHVYLRALSSIPSQLSCWGKYMMMWIPRKMLVKRHACSMYETHSVVLEYHNNGQVG